MRLEISILILGWAKMVNSFLALYWAISTALAIIFLVRENVRHKFVLAILVGPARRVCNGRFNARLPLLSLACVIGLVLILLSGGSAFAQTAPSSPNVFGSNALPIAHTPLDGKWHAARQGGVPANDASLKALISRNRAVSREQQLAAVNSWVNNRIAYVADQANHGQSDRWVAAAQSIRDGRGDCEDYAIAKYQIMRELGVAEQDIFLVIGRDRAMRTDHAVLAVRVGSDYRILDNFTDRVLNDGEMRDFLPTFSYSSSQTWLHGQHLVD